MYVLISRKEPRADEFNLKQIHSYLLKSLKIISGSWAVSRLNVLLVEICPKKRKRQMYQLLPNIIQIALFAGKFISHINNSVGVSYIN